MATATRLTTLAKFLANSEVWEQIEVYDGMATEADGVGIEHGDVAFEFGRLLGNHVAERGLGRLYRSDTRYVLQTEPLRTVAPDISFVRTDRLPPRHDWGRPFLIPPDLAVEILSPHSAGPRLERKLRYYRDAGVSLVLLVDVPRRTIVAHAADGARREYGIGDVLDGGTVLPDLRIAVADVFR
jgi:Uma2 family endonuclease